MNINAYERILILGLDALPWELTCTLMDAGLLPFLKRLRDEGCSGVLQSTLPPQTPGAWTSFMTGVHPGTHGIIDWERFDPVTQQSCLHNAKRFAGKTIYHRLAAAGRRVGVIVQPACYPPFELHNGYVLSGIDTPDLKAPFVNPHALRDEVLSISPQHDRILNMDLDWTEAGHEHDDAVFERNIETIMQYVRRVTQLAKGLYVLHPTDVTMVYWHAPDVLLHRAWHWCDPAGVGAVENPRRHRQVCAFFKVLDEAVQELCETIPSAGRLTLALSDHGQRADALRVRLNSILIELGYLVPAGGLGLLKDGLRRIRESIEGQDKRVGVGLPIDWGKTRAFMPFQACTGFIYLNLKGRQPYGSVQAGDYLKVRDELIESLRRYRDPQCGACYFEEVGATDGLFKRKDELLLPDIYVQPAAGVEFVRKAVTGEIAYPTKRAYAGLHDPAGLYILHGVGVKARQHHDAHIVDLAPTLLAAAGQSVPTYMEGAGLGACFEMPLQIRSVDEPWDAEARTENAYSAEQEAAIEARLKDLGYLE